MEIINDDLFGELVYKCNFWRGKVFLTMFNVKTEIRLTVDAHETADFSTVQREAFLNFIGQMKTIINQAEKQVYHYYNENYEEYREMLGSESEENRIIPKVDSVLDLKNFVKPTELIIRRVRANEKRRLGLLFDTSWDMENGLGIKIENEIVEEVGYQDIVL